MLSSFGFVSSAYMSDSDVSRRKMTTTTRIHIMALDGIVNVNSLFTLALFLGITTTSTTNTLIGDDNAACAAGASISEGLIAFHVYSFSSFLFSSLIALALKNIINFSKDIKDGDVVLDNNNNNWVHSAAKINTVVLRLGTLVSAFGSVFGCGFLVMALVDLVQIKLGTLACACRKFVSCCACLGGRSDYQLLFVKQN
ncbi:hypothetical protein GLYMA_12G058600v4 [Glycine max]|nr:hypothetical protein GLYMA_12G058600v4 [Glycine max]KAG4385279.1 hypothetical protein GLYMA_12G058600v4 [Glycine max]KAH1141821.1 hypothetical protein GYH30_032832 [Glycine max]KAH1141823.1 hypothetical protein GYH30_032832 [Glycine max]